jgi:hypothetical protein
MKQKLDFFRILLNLNIAIFLVPLTKNNNNNNNNDQDMVIRDSLSYLLCKFLLF